MNALNKLLQRYKNFLAGMDNSPFKEESWEILNAATTELATLRARLEKAEALARAAKNVLKNLSLSEIIDIDEKEYNIWSIVSDAEKDELGAALAEWEQK